MMMITKYTVSVTTIFKIFSKDVCRPHVVDESVPNAESDSEYEHYPIRAKLLSASVLYTDADPL